jgi:phage-related protein
MASFPTPLSSPAAPNPTIGPSSREYTAKILETKMGDGYRQRAGNGINAIDQNYNVGWENITTTEKNTIRDFLIARAGWDAFVWTAPGDSASSKWTCVTFKETDKGSGYWSFSAVFRKEFDV